MKKTEEYIFMSDGYRGGANNFLNDHMNYLVDNKKKVLLIDKDPSKTYNKLSYKIKTYKINININNKKNINSLCKIIKFSKNNKKYIVITNYAFLIKYFWVFKKFKRENNKIILTIHSGIFNLNLKSYIAGLVFSFIHKEIDHLFFGSNSAKLWWKKLFPWMRIDKSLVHYNGIKLKRNIKPKNIKKNVQISFAGRLEKENDPEFFIEIAKEYLKENRNAIFNIFGDGSLLKELRMKYASKKILFHGWKSKEKIYSISNLIVITSPINNFPYVALESKSYGIPVLSCSKGDIDKIIKNNVDGCLKYTRSKYEMVNLLKKIEKNYYYFSKNSVERSKKFELSHSCKIFWNSINV